MRLLALVAWLLTAAGGSLLLVTWLRHGGLGQTEGVRATRLLPHASLAVLGLALWIAYMAADRTALAWAAVGCLLLVAGIGVAMLAVTLARTHESGPHPRPRGRKLPAPGRRRPRRAGGDDARPRRAGGGRRGMTVGSPFRVAFDSLRSG